MATELNKLARSGRALAQCVALHGRTGAARRLALVQPISPF